MEQQYYTSSLKRMDGLSGFGILAQTESLAPEDIAAINMHNHYYKPMSLDDAAVEEAPVSLSFYHLGDKCFGVTNSRYLGKDYTGRWGNFFAHTVVFKSADLVEIDYSPIVLFGQKFWVIQEPDNQATLPLKLESFPKTAAINASIISKFFVETPERSIQLGLILQAVIDKKTTGRQIILVDSPMNIPKWIYAINVALPPLVRPSLTFSTYERDPSTVNVDIVGMYPGEAETYKTGTHRFQFLVFDMISNLKPEDLQPNKAATILSSLTANGNDSKIAQIHSKAQRLKIKGLDEIEPTVSLDIALSRTPNDVPTEILMSALNLLVRQAEASPEESSGMALDLLGCCEGQHDDESLKMLLIQTKALAIKCKNEDEWQRRLVMMTMKTLSTGSNSSWLAIVGSESKLIDLRSALANGVSIESWKSYILNENNSEKIQNVWWLFDTFLSQPDANPSESFWKDIAKSTEKCDKLVLLLRNTIRNLSNEDPDWAGNILDLIGNDLYANFPQQVFGLALDLAVNSASNNHLCAEDDAMRCATFISANVNVEHEIEKAISAFNQYPNSSLAFIGMLEKDSLIEISLKYLAKISGSDGMIIRQKLIREDRFKKLVDLLIDLDLKTNQPAEIMTLWIGTQSILSDDMKENIITRILNKISEKNISESEIQKIIKLFPIINQRENLENRFEVLLAAHGPMMPFSKSQQAMLNNMDEVPAATIPRLHMRFNLTQLIAKSNLLEDWDDFIKITKLDQRWDLESGDYQEYLKHVFDCALQSKIFPPSDSSEQNSLKCLIARSNTSVFLVAYTRYLGKFTKKLSTDRAAIAARLLLWDLALNVIPSEDHLKDGNDFLQSLPSDIRKKVADMLTDDLSDLELMRKYPDAKSFLNRVSSMKNKGLMNFFSR